MNTTALQAFSSHVLESYPHEACGFILRSGEYISLQNYADDPQHRFSISSTDYLRHAADIAAVAHSHIAGTQNGIDTRAPSYADMTAQRSMAVPFYIVATDGENVSEPVVFGGCTVVPIIGRQFTHNVYDCWELTRDTIQLLQYENYSVDELLSMDAPVEIDHYDIDNVARDPTWFSDDIDLFGDNWQQLGFRRVAEPQIGDMILMRYESSRANHAGIYLGSNQLLHHLPGRLSAVTPYSRYRKIITDVMRHDCTTR